MDLDLGLRIQPYIHKAELRIRLNPLFRMHRDVSKELDPVPVPSLTFPGSSGFVNNTVSHSALRVGKVKKWYFQVICLQ